MGTTVVVARASGYAGGELLRLPAGQREPASRRTIIGCGAGGRNRDDVRSDKHIASVGGVQAQAGDLDRCADCSAWMSECASCGPV
jgi:hypothetical protein